MFLLCYKTHISLFIITLIFIVEMIITNMAEGKSQQLFQDSWCQIEDQSNRKCSSSTTSSIGEESTVSNGSSITSSDTADDASSFSSANSSRSSYDLSEIMAQLPIKRGLSKFYQGKSESFTALSRVTSVEDLAKRATPCRRNMKASKSIATGLHSYKSYTLPKPIIAKKNHKGFFFSK